MDHSIPADRGLVEMACLFTSGVSSYSCGRPVPKWKGVRANRREFAELEGRLTEAQQRVAALERELRACRTRDTLTGLCLLDTVMRRLGPEIERCKRHSPPLTMAVIEVDGMRAINVHHGRAVGDRVMVGVAKTLTKHTRASDAVSRSGPGEFAILMPETDVAGALQALDRIILELEALRVDHVESVSISAGVAEWVRPLTGEQLLEVAVTRAGAARSMGGGRVQSGDLSHQAAGGESQAGKGDVVAALAEALLERDRYTGEHSGSVVQLVERVAGGLALSGSEVDTVKAAALLHDIGKVAMPDHVLNKPGPLDEGEWSVMREHPVIGERILRAIPGMGVIARIVRHEHERFDGGGYPDGLAGEEIPIGARIILACDAYHAMTSDRPYRRAMPHGDAIRELAAGAGTQFDPAVTEVLIGCLYGRREPAAGGAEAAAASAAA